MSTIRYRHGQFGKTLVVALGVAVAICLSVAGLCRPGAPIAMLAAGICLFGAYLFSSLNIAVTDEHLRWSFGPGLIHKQVPLTEIADVQVTRTRFIEGWGIHLTTRGWLYNVSGFEAVAGRLNSGRRFLRGTDEPEKLAAVLRKQ